MTSAAAEKSETPLGMFKPTERLHQMKAAWEAGVLPALYDAIQLCRLSGAAPDWVFAGARKVIEDRLQNGKKLAKGGPGGNETSKHSLDLKHFHRWRLVTTEMKNGKSKTAACKAVSQNLFANKNKTGAQWEAIRDSYDKVEEDWANPTERQKYYLPVFVWTEGAEL